MEAQVCSCHAWPCVIPTKTSIIFLCLCLFCNLFLSPAGYSAVVAESSTESALSTPSQSQSSQPSSLSSSTSQPWVLIPLSHLWAQTLHTSFLLTCLAVLSAFHPEQDGQWPQFNQLDHPASQLTVPLVLRQHTRRRESSQRASLLHTSFWKSQGEALQLCVRMYRQRLSL